MANTFNRKPYTLNTPSNNDIKTYNFIHSNWKGISLDKNFLEVDQETFEDSKNVYVDAEGLLRSRPSSKITHIKTSNGILNNIIDVWNFVNLNVYMTEDSGINKLHFVKNNGENLEVNTESKIKLVLAEQKIFVFSENSLHYYDIENNEYFDAEDYIYVPIAKIYKNNAQSDFEEFNELTTSYKNRYLFDNVDDINFAKLVGKNVTITIGDKSYNIKFNENQQYVIVEKKLDLNDDNFITLQGCDKYPLISVAENDTYILSSTINNVLQDKNSYNIYFTTDNITFKQLPFIDNVVGIPKITKNGTHAYCMKEDDLYVISVIDSENEGDYYDTWTPLLQTVYSEYYKSFRDKPWHINDKYYVTAEMDSIDIFVIRCNPVQEVETSQSSTNNMGIICCNKGEISNMLTNMERTATLDSEHSSNTDWRKNLTVPGQFEIIEQDLNLLQDSHHVYDEKDKYARYFTRLMLYSIKRENLGLHCKNTIKGRVQVDLGYTPTGVNVYKHDYEFEVVLSDENALTIENCRIEISANVITCKAKETISVDILNHTKYTNDLVTNDTLSKIPKLYSVGAFSKMIPFIKINVKGTVFDVLVDNFDVKLIDINTMSMRTLDYVAYYLSPEVYCANSNDIYFYDGGFAYIRHSRGIELFYDYVLYEETGDVINKIFILSNYDLITSDKYTTNAVFDNYGNLAVSNYLYLREHKYQMSVPFIFDAVPISYHNSLMVTDFKNLYSTYLTNDVAIDVVVKGTIKYLLPEHTAELSNFYFSTNKTLYISQYPTTGDFKWYFPKINTEIFDYKITNLHAISETEVAVFTQNNVYYVKNTEQGYMYYKSKIQVGCKDGADVLTTFDGVYTIFASDRGIVAMTYQQFVATTEQALSYLTDAIYNLYNKYNNEPIKLFKYLFWIVCYKKGSKDVLVFDTRNNSWWYNTGNYPIDKIVNNDNAVMLLMKNEMFLPNTTDVNYYDFDAVKSYIDWYIKSQKLHLKSVDYQKNIRDITLISVLDTDKPINCKLQLINYRKSVKEGKEQLLEYNIDTIRTFVKHLNCMKVNQTQYIIKSNEESYLQIPLSLSSINIKYRITRQVR